MARLFTSGFEWNEAAGTAEGLLVGGSPTIVTTPVRNGTYAASFAASLTYYIVSVTGVSGVTYYFRTCFRINALPAAGTVALLVTFRDPTSQISSIGVDSSGNVGIYNQSNLLSGSTFAASANTYYCLETALTVFSGSNTNNSLVMRINEQVISTALASEAWGSTTTLLTSIRFGFPTSTGATGITVFHDDVALNDSTGVNENSWCRDARVLLHKAISLNANGGSWTDDAAATTSAALTAPLDNTPPLGIADTTAGGGNHQDRNAGANSSLDMNLETYTTKGLAATEYVKVLVPVCCVGAPVSTGGKSGSLGVVSNPTIAQQAFTGGSGTAAFFWGGAAPGTYPTNWRWERGTTTYNPTGIASGTSPVARLSITAGTTSRIAMCCAMGIYAEYAPRRSLIHNEVRRRNLQKMIGR